MMSKNHHLEIALKSIEAFQNKGRIDADELSEMIAIAERDGVIDQNEIRVLRNIIARVNPEEVDHDMRLVMTSLIEKIKAN